MDASQYKDYVLVLLFVKYVSDKFKGPYAEIAVPDGASFQDMVALKGKTDIGDKINKQIVGPLAKANKLANVPDFNDEVKLGGGKERVQRLTNLIAIFENPALDFSKNREEDDDLLGDAYEYLMRKFATESGKSKGQFYTPSEVSSVIAQILGIREAKTSTKTSVYDPTCGSGSLLLKVGGMAKDRVTLNGQEKDSATSALAQMNTILHNMATAVIRQGNTLTAPKFLDKTGKMEQFDYVVANPPFSDKRWSTGLDPENDLHRRFEYGIPPEKQGDFAYLLHIIRSLNSKGKGACILPHGVLFRGNAEAEIRKNLVRQGYIKGIIGLPANLFYGTGIPACILVLDKEAAAARKGIFMIDAAQGFTKDGNKNRLRSKDIHRIVDVFQRQEGAEKYARMVPYGEIQKNDFNLNLPRYIDSSEPEDMEDIDGHLRGGIPEADVAARERYWSVCPGLKKTLFKKNRAGYFDLKIDPGALKSTIYEHPEFAAYIDEMNSHFDVWRKRTRKKLRALKTGCRPREIIETLSEDLLEHYQGKPLIDPYDVYQHLMEYAAETMQDDLYLIAADGWKAETYIVRETKSKREWTCDLVPKEYVVARFFAAEQEEIDDLQTELEQAIGEQEELEEEHGGDDGALCDVGNQAEAKGAWYEAVLAFWKKANQTTFRQYSEAVSELGKAEAEQKQLEDDGRLRALEDDRGRLSQARVKARFKETADTTERAFLEGYFAVQSQASAAKKIMKELYATQEQETRDLLPTEPEREDLGDLRILDQYIRLLETIADSRKQIKAKEAELDQKAYKKYPELSEEEVKLLAVDDKWLTTISTAVHGEMDRISQSLTGRIKELADRYGKPLPELVDAVAELEAKVNGHLAKMGFA